MNTFIKSINWFDLVPSGLAGMKNLITVGGGTVNQDDYVSAAATPSGNLLVAYISPAHSGSITVDMTAMFGSAEARWYNPTDASYTTIAGSPFANIGTRQFTPPGNNGTGYTDWVLILEANVVPDTTSPSVPTNLSATGISSSGIALNWAASTDNVAVAGYKVFRGGLQIATTTQTNYTDNGLSVSTSYTYTVSAFDASGNVSDQSTTATGTTLSPDIIAPSVPQNLSAVPNVGQIALSWSASTDDSGIVAGYQVFRDSILFSTTTLTSFVDTGLNPAVTHEYAVAAYDWSGNVSSQSLSVSTTTPNTPSGIVAGFALNEGSGSITNSSYVPLTGTLVGSPAWTAGKYGNALNFSGTNYVNLGNPASLQLTGSITLSAWINISSNPWDDGAIIAKLGSNSLGWQLKTTPDTGSRTAAIQISSNGSDSIQRYSSAALALNTWYHIAGVYNASARTLDIYVNGVLNNGILSGTVPASMFNSTQNVNIAQRTGDPSTYNFRGIIDNVRVYNRVLNSSEIQADMNTPLP